MPSPSACASSFNAFDGRWRSETLTAGDMVMRVILVKGVILASILALIFGHAAWLG